MPPLFESSNLIKPAGKRLNIKTAASEGRGGEKWSYTGRFDTKPRGYKKENAGIKLDAVFRLRLRGTKDVWKSTLVGMLGSRCFIVSIPHIPGLWVKLDQEDHISVRYLHKGKVYGFHSTLVGYIDEPFRLAFISCPEKIEVMGLRRHKRTVCLLPAQLSIDGVSYRGVITDISVGGCSFLFDRVGTEEGMGAVSFGDKVAFSVRFTVSSEAKAMNATVKHIRAVGKRTSVGAQFDDPDDALIALITEYIREAGIIGAR